MESKYNNKPTKTQPKRINSKMSNPKLHLNTKPASSKRNLVRVNPTDLKLWQAVIASFTGACFAEVLTLPLDVIKVSLQIKQGAYNGYFDCAKTIARKEGFSSFFKGMEAGVIRQFFFGTIRLVLFDYSKAELAKMKGGADKLVLLDRICLGFITGCLAMTVANPSDVIKVRIQADSVNNQRYRNFFHAFYTIAKEEGFRGFYQSLPPNIMRNSTTNAASMATYDQVKSTLLNKGLMEDGIGLHIVSSTLAGTAATMISSPFDVIKSNIMAGKKLADGTIGQFKNQREAISYIYGKGGFSGFYKGLLPITKRVVGFNIIMFVIKEELMYRFDRMNKKNEGPEGEGSTV